MSRSIALSISDMSRRACPLKLSMRAELPPSVSASIIFSLLSRSARASGPFSAAISSCISLNCDS